MVTRRKFILRNGLMIPAALALPRVAFPQVLLQGRKNVRFPPAAAGGGPNAYFYTTVAAKDTTSTWNGSESYKEWLPITSVTGGTLTKIGLNFHTCTVNGNVKFGLYTNPAGNYVTGATGVIALATGDTNDQWRDITGLSISISTGDYWVAMQPSSAVSFQVNAVVNSGKGPYSSGNTYAAFPTSTVGTQESVEGKQLLFRIFVQ